MLFYCLPHHFPPSVGTGFDPTLTVQITRGICFTIFLHWFQGPGSVTQAAVEDATSVTVIPRV